MPPPMPLRMAAQAPAPTTTIITEMMMSLKPGLTGWLLEDFAMTMIKPTKKSIPVKAQYSKDNTIIPSIA